MRHASAATASASSGHDRAEELEGRLQAERLHERAGQDRGQRDRGVGDDVEGRHDLGAVLGRDRGAERAQAAEEGDAEARAADQRADPEQRGRLGPGGEHDRDHARGQRERAAGGARPTARCGRTRAVRRRPRRPARTRRGRQRGGCRCGRDRAASAGPSDRNSPPIDQLEITASAARKNGRRTVAGTCGRCGVRRTRPVALDGLGHQQRADEGDREQDEQDDVGQHARRGRELDERGGDQHAEAHAARADDAVGEADLGRVAVRVQVQQRGAGGAEREAGGDALDAARDEQPRRRVREHEQHGGGHQRPERGQQHGPAADLVAEPAGEQQRRQHAEGVGRVDEREHDRREAPQLAVGAVQRRGSAGGEQREADHGGDVGVGEAGSQRAPGFD